MAEKGSGASSVPRVPVHKIYLDGIAGFLGYITGQAAIRRVRLDLFYEGGGQDYLYASGYGYTGEYVEWSFTLNGSLKKNVVRAVAVGEYQIGRNKVEFRIAEWVMENDEYVFRAGDTVGFKLRLLIGGQS